MVEALEEWGEDKPGRSEIVGWEEGDGDKANTVEGKGKRREMGFKNVLCEEEDKDIRAKEERDEGWETRK